MISSQQLPLLATLLQSWDRHQTVLLNLLSAVPAGGLAARVMPGSPTVAEMFTHLHHERMVSVQENAPEHAGEVPAVEWNPEPGAERIADMLRDSAGRVRRAVESRTLESRALDLDFPHPLYLLQFLLFHESYHFGQIRLALKAAGTPVPDSTARELFWEVWRAK